MKLIHVVPHVNQEASGPAYSVPRLCQALSGRGHEVELSCLAARGTIPGVTLDVHRQWAIPRRLAVSPSHAIALRDKASRVDVIHNHSLWSMVNVATGWVVPGKRAKLVMSPRGTLSQWARSRSKTTKLALWPLQRRALTKAALLHATSAEELEQMRGLGFRAPIAVIPNGIDLPCSSRLSTAAGTRTLLFLGRIHPTKCVDRLLQAWGMVQERHADWRLVIAGPGERAYVRQLQALAASLALARVEFSGPAYGEEKSRLYREADLFVLPSHSENFGVAVAEALAHGCAAVVSKGAPWAGIPIEGCGWWVDHDVSSLAETLEGAMGLPSLRLAQMGELGRAWMKRDFSWDIVAERMDRAYHWTLHGGTCPEFVYQA